MIPRILSQRFISSRLSRRFTGDINIHSFSSMMVLCRSVLSILHAATVTGGDHKFLIRNIEETTRAAQRSMRWIQDTRRDDSAHLSARSGRYAFKAPLTESAANTTGHFTGREIDRYCSANLSMAPLSSDQQSRLGFHFHEIALKLDDLKFSPRAKTSSGIVPRNPAKRICNSSTSCPFIPF